MRIKTISNWKNALAIAVSLLAATHVAAQTHGIQRITQKIDEKNLVTLKGNTHPLAQSRYDQGAAPDSLPLNRMMLVLQRSSSQETALQQLIDQQQDKSSANYHKWLTPAQFGAQFGPADADIQTVTSWLQTQGFTVNHVSAGKTIIEFNGNAGLVRQAFHTEIHRYVVKGEDHWANNADPQIPAALAPVVAGINSLHNFFRKPLSRKLGTFSRAQATGAVTPLFSYAGGNGTLNALGPCDFAAIYNILPLWNTSLANCGTSAMPASSNDGTGQQVAIVAETDINPTDVANFRQQFGLPTTGYTQPAGCSQFYANVCLILDGPDPGITDEETEADLDVQWSGATAKGAVIDFVVSESTETDQGIDLSAEYIIDNNIAHVMSESYGACEYSIGTTGNEFYSFLWEQAAAQGMTVIISAGDEGSAGCDDPDLPSPNVAEGGLAVNGLASTPYNVAIGGTDFDISVANYQSTYWSASASNPSTQANPVSAKGYIPETTWNDTCAQTGLSCSAPPNQDYISVVGGGGGESNCEGANAQGNCVGYAKPPWQTGTGVPNDSVRDVPDISFFAADGFVSGSFYIVCQQDQDPNGATAGCNLSAPFTDFVGVGGTSSGAPAFAGIMAMVNQKTASQGQGNANYILYRLAASETGNCNSSSGSASTCVFNDITKGNNSVPCEVGSLNCGNTTSNTDILVSGATAGFTTGTGYDLATGLGTLNAYNLVQDWSSVSFTATNTVLTLNPTTLTHGASVTAGVTVTPDPVVASSTRPEDVTLLSDTPNGSIGPLLTGSGNNASYTFNLNTNGTLTGTTTYLPGGTYQVTARYAGDGLYGASTSTPVNVTVNPEPSTTLISTLNVNLLSGAVNNVISDTYGDFDLIRVDVVGTASDKLGETSCENTDETCATGTATLLDNGQPLDPGMFPGGKLTLNAAGYAEVQTTLQVGPGAIFIPALTVGSHSFQATYSGDPSFNASTSAAVPFTVTQAVTGTAITSSPTSVQSGATFSVTATVSTAGFGNAPTGTVTFTAGGQTLPGTVTLTPLSPTVTSFSALQATLTGASITTSGSLTITATYSGDANYIGSSGTAPITVTGGNAKFTVSANPTSITIATPGQPGTTTATVAANGFTGTVSLTCSVSPTNGTDPPTCSMSPASVTLASGTATAPSTLAVATTAASAIYKPGNGPISPGSYLRAKTAAAVLACALLLVLVLPAKKRRLSMVLGLMVFAVALCGEGCGGGGSGGGFSTGNPGTAVGTYTVTITATSGGTTAATTVSLTVN